MFLSKMSFLDSVEHDPAINAPCLYSISIVFWNGCDMDVGTSPTVLEVKVVWAGICHDVHIQLKIVQGTLNAVKYRYDLLGLIVLPFLEQHPHMKYISDDTIFQSL